MKRLVVCFDGTWNAADGGKAETNVARMARAIRGSRDLASIQLVLYLRGVGSTGILADRVVAGATGRGINDIIRSAYMFLCQNYVPADGDNPADEIYLFGFSRGAFAARSMAGMIGACGLLKRQSLDRIADAWSFYRTAPERKPDIFKRTTGIDTHTGVEIKFLGVWDTVGALGIPPSFVGDLFKMFGPNKYGFHNTEPSPIIRYGAHALAVNEYRDEYVPTLWTGSTPNGCTIEQVWFAGAHSDIGGGYESQDAADIPLRWMAKRAEKNGLQIDWACLPEKGNPLSPIHDSRQGLSIKDRFTPTIRAVCDTEVDVGPFERLHYAMDAEGNRLEPIGEALHESLVTRWNSETLTFFQDGSDPAKDPYVPKNLRPFFTKTGKLRPKVPVARDE